MLAIIEEQDETEVLGMFVPKEKTQITRELYTRGGGENTGG